MQANYTNELICLSIAILIYVIGVWFHIKIINVSRREKDTTWQCDVTNSVMLVCFNSHSLIIHSLTIFVDNLYLYTGTWFCYTSKVISLYGNFYVLGHSLVISVMKYILIVRWEHVAQYGKEKVKKIFFWINILHPMVMIVLHLINRPDFFWVYDGYPQFDRCMGDPKNNWIGDKNKSLTKLHNLCSYVESSSSNVLNFVSNVLRSSYCWLLVMIYYIICLNILEGIIYCKIFRFMKRQTNPSTNRAAELLSDDVNEFNSKRVKINAQVTAIISFLEVFGNLMGAIIVLLVTRANTSGIIVIGLIIYFIVIPHAFLMNTFHNKNRIVEYGWKNVLKNLLGMATNECSKVSPENFVKSKYNNEKNIDMSQKLEVEDLEETSSTPSGSDSSSNEVKLSNISKFNNNDISLSKIERSKAHTSTKSYNGIIEYPFSHLDVKQLMAEDVKSTLVNTLIDHLKNSLDNEEKYVFYFRQLINVHEDAKKGISCHDIRLKSYYEDKNQQKFSNCKSVSPQKFKNAKRSSQVRSHKTSSIDKTTLDFRKDFTGNIKERSQRRLEVLRKFENSYDYWKQFDLFLEEMIDMEESFIT